MKKLSASLALLMLTLSAGATGWVYMGLYPYMYDLNSARWSYSSAPVLWHVDVLNSSWYSIGEQPPNRVPDLLPGLVAALQRSQGGVVYIYFYLNNEAILVSPVGVQTQYTYYFEDLGNDTALIAMKDYSLLLDESFTIALKFSGVGQGYYSGVVLRDDDVSQATGTFGLYLF